MRLLMIDLNANVNIPFCSKYFPLSKTEFLMILPEEGVIKFAFTG